MNNNRKAVKRAEHKRFSRERQKERAYNRQQWLEQKMKALGDVSEEALCHLLGKTLDWVKKYRYGTFYRY